MQALIEVGFTKNVIIVKHTSSKKCDLKELSDVKDDDGEFRPIKIEFKSRRIDNKILYLLYKVLRIFYVSCFFYFVPFTAIIISTLMPLLFRNYAMDMPYCPALN